jgi:N-acetylmuramic acid 6-phosphate etherase
MAENHAMAERCPTEAILERARDLDRQSVGEILRLIHEEDALAHAAVGSVLGDVERAVDVLVPVVGGGGRWFNVGAGTSGRMGVLDASEIPPTFGMHSKVVQGVIAGGDRALREAVEGAEDNFEAGGWELRERGLCMGDALVAISASGRTPFVLGAVEVAHEAGARSIGITCDRDSPLADAVEIAIVLEVGPEVVAGSTRMKGGLAQKMVLHLLSTAVMVKLGRVEGNLMTNLALANEKLRGRALQIVMTLSGVDCDRAGSLLEAHEGCVESAVRAARAEHSRGS